MIDWIKENILGLPVLRYKIGPECKWEDIKVGEVFGAEGCFWVGYKISDISLIVIDSDTECNSNEDYGNQYSIEIADLYTHAYRKLPKETQQLYYIKGD